MENDLDKTSHIIIEDIIASHNINKRIIIFNNIPASGVGTHLFSRLHSSTYEQKENVTEC